MASNTAIRFLLDTAQSHGHKAVEDPIDEHWSRTPPTLKPFVTDGGDVVRQAKQNSIADVYGREWFERLCVVQEVVLGKKPTIYCGSLQLDWDLFG